MCDFIWAGFTIKSCGIWMVQSFFHQHHITTSNVNFKFKNDFGNIAIQKFNIPMYGIYLSQKNYCEIYFGG